VVRFYGVGASTTKGISGLQGLYKVESVYKVSDFLSLLFHLLPLTFPYFDHVVFFVSEVLHFLLGALVYILKTTIFETLVRLGAVGEAFWATVPETPVELIDGVGEFVVAICLVATVGDSVFSFVGCMSNAIVLTCGLWKTMFLPVQPFQCNVGLIGLDPPSVQGF